MIIRPGRYRVARGNRRACRSQPTGNDLGHRPCQVLGHFLRQVSQAQVLLSRHAAMIGEQVAVDQLEQGRFACPVAPQQAYPLASFDLQINIFQEQRSAKTQAYFLQAD